jgi:hypothetical protein
VSQNHLTLAFPLKTPSDIKALTDQLSPMMPALFGAEDAIGTVHYSRFTVLSERTLLFLADFDGEFTQLMAELARLAGPVFDAIFQHVANPPPTPVADNADAFVEWTAEHLVHPLNAYTAYPDVTAAEVKALAAAAGVSAGGERRPFLVIPGFNLERPLMRNSCASRPSATIVRRNWRVEALSAHRLSEGDGG